MKVFEVLDRIQKFLQGYVHVNEDDNQELPKGFSKDANDAIQRS